MEAVLTLDADDTHLYPGARLTTHEAAALPSRSAEAAVVFRDRSFAEAVLAPADDGSFVLRVEAYTTAAGTAVRARSWRLTAADDGTLAVKSRADPSP